MKLIRSGILLASAASVLALGACSPTKSADQASKRSGGGHGERNADQPANGRHDRQARRRHGPAGYAGSAKGHHRPAGAANGGRGGGGQEGTGQDPRGRGTVRRDQAIGSGQCLRRGLHQEQSGQRRHAEGRVRAHQGDDHRHGVQGAPHPGGEGIRSQGHHRQTEEGSGGLRRNWRWRSRRTLAPRPAVASWDGSIREEWFPNSAPP